MAKVLLYAPRDFGNVCVLARTLEVLGYSECFVFDTRRIIRDRYGKSYARRLRVVSAGAFDRIRWLRTEDPAALLERHEGRTIATVVGGDAESLFDFRFAPDDLLVFGSEGQGLPPEIIRLCSARVTIPMRGKTRSLNLAVAAGIFLCEVSRQRATREARAGSERSRNERALERDRAIL